ncbi:MAG: carboxypeptidase regulatory-like domain-containing protein [Planctomycetes bacterium]|nr:carboxypeptidase regulatory-like domain-containing protein [Planctomycetota bacterium]
MTISTVSRVVLLGSLVITASAQLQRDLRGIVRTPDGERVRVTVWHNAMRRGTIEPLAEGFAAADGTFAFDNVAWFDRYAWGFNTVVIVARAATRCGLLEVRGEDAATDNLDIALAEAITLRGVLQDERGKPIAGAWVWPTIFGDRTEGRPTAWVTAPLLPWHTRTDEKGEFQLAGLPPMPSFKLLAGGAGHARTWVTVENPASRITGTLALGGVIRGKVLLPDGSVAVRARVCANGNGIGYGRTTTADDGTFELTDLAADRYKVWAEVQDLTVIACRGLEIEAGTKIDDQVVQLVHGGFIVGRIVDAETGKPIVPGPHTDVAMYGPARPDGGACESTPVQPDGTFRIRAPAGVNEIYLRSANGYNEPRQNVEVVEGKETEVEWRLRRGR